MATNTVTLEVEVKITNEAKRLIYQQAKERYDLLQAQRKTLRDALETLNKSLAEVARTYRDALMQYQEAVGITELPQELYF